MIRTGNGDNLEKNPKTFTLTLIFLSVTLLIVSSSSITVTAREEMSVQIISPPSEIQFIVNTEVQLVANATGGSGEFLYRWYANGVAINDNFTSATCIFNVTQLGTYTIGCLVADATGLFPGSVAAPEILLYVTQPMVAAQGPATTSESENSWVNQNLTLIIAAVSAIIVIIAVAIVAWKKIK
jgi:hypothetical protein